MKRYESVIKRGKKKKLMEEDKNEKHDKNDKKKA